MDDQSTGLIIANPSFRTALGGFGSLIAYGILISVVYTLSSVLVNKSNISTSEKSTYYDTTKFSQSHQVLTNGLKLAFKMYDTGVSSDTIGIYAQLVTMQNQSITESVYLPLKSGLLSDFAGSTINIEYSDYATGFSFPENVTINGAFHSKTYSYVKIIFWHNNGETAEECKVVASQENVYSFMQVHVVTPYVDYQDISEPIKYAYSDKYYTYVDTKSFTIQDLFIRK